jgi:hypothetical protein
MHISTSRTHKKFTPGPFEDLGISFSLKTLGIEDHKHKNGEPADRRGGGRC